MSHMNRVSKQSLACWLLVATWSLASAVHAEGPAAMALKGYRLQDLGRGLYLVADHDSQSLFMVYDRGVVVIDAPPSFAAHLPQAIAEVTPNPVTHVVYTQSRAEQIGGVTELGGQPVIIAQEETAQALVLAADPRRPLPTVVFADEYTLQAGDMSLELSHHGDDTMPESTFVFAPVQRVLMIANLILPRSRPWRRFAVIREAPVAPDTRLEAIRRLPWTRLVSSRPGETIDAADAGGACFRQPCLY
jgi:glyoxylase-like metal-dependent hydrolase (beta-lactamase superfamily II)